MVLKSLQHRIVVVFVGLLVLVMALILALVNGSNQRIVTAEAQRELDAGKRVFERVIEQNRRQLETAATVLAGDFAFREAIATQDQSTVLSVIRNHGLRIGAQAMMVVSPDGRLLAHTQHEAGNDAANRPSTFPFLDLLADAQLNGKGSGFRQMRDDMLYQIVLVPINAPRLIAWVAMGFQVDDGWANDVADMTGLSVSIVQHRTGTATLLASSLNTVERPQLLPALSTRTSPGVQDLTLGEVQYQTTQLALSPDVSVVLQRSLEQVRAPFHSLQTALLATLLGGVAIFSFGSVMLARRIVRPVKALTTSAQRIETGDYTHPMPTLPPDEIGQLASSFDHMRQQIASREDKILRLAYADALTGLPNRTRFVESFDQLPAGSCGAVALLNIDRFAMINNALGHTVGDRLLQEIGHRLNRIAPAPRSVARLWGNEFAFLQDGVDKACILTFVQSVLDALRDPITLDGQRLDVGGSLGIALYPQDGSDATTLIRRAEQALASAKRRHDGYAFAADIGAQPVHEQLSLIGEMREALKRQEFLLYYQPKLDLVSGQITGVEALLRWHHPTRGLVQPVHFIPFAEQTGFIREITPWLLSHAADQAAQWQRQGLSIAVSVNLSALDVLNPQLVAHVRRLLEQHRQAPVRLCLEITESALMHEPEIALAHLHALSAMGVELSIDDYGSGQASLAYLKTLPVHELKIDQTFITDVAGSPKNAAIVRSTILLSHELGLTVTAEGAETDADLQWLTANGCDLAQGYGIARPMPAPDLPVWVEDFNARTT